jgi:hypothetical protein
VAGDSRVRRGSVSPALLGVLALAAARRGGNQVRGHQYTAASAVYQAAPELLAAMEHHDHGAQQDRLYRLAEPAFHRVFAL